MSSLLDITSMGPCRCQGVRLMERRVFWCLITMNQPPSLNTGYRLKSEIVQFGNWRSRSTPAPRSSCSVTSSRLDGTPGARLTASFTNHPLQFESLCLASSAVTTKGIVKQLDDSGQLPSVPLRRGSVGCLWIGHPITRSIGGRPANKYNISA